MSTNITTEEWTTIKERVHMVAHALQISQDKVFENLPHLNQATPFVFDVPQVSNIAHFIDHTLLKPNATKSEVEKICDEAIQHHFAAVCVNGCRVSNVFHRLRDFHKDSSVKIAAVVGFPLGANTTSTKAIESKELIPFVDELDMVMNVGSLLDNNVAHVLQDIREVVKTVEGTNKIVKVILETSLLNKEQIIDACIISVLAGAHFVKTCTGFASGGVAKVEDVRLMKAVVGNRAQVKASAGIRTYADALAMVQNGASRIGASAGVAIVQGEVGSSSY